MLTRTSVLGAILAGGAARRFGSDKALASLAGRHLIDHVATALGRDVAALVVIGREHPGHPSAPDWPERGLGPLGGIAGALRVACAGGQSAVLTAPCDTPILPERLLAMLAAAGAPACLAVQPTIGLWPVALADPLADWLAAGRPRAVRRWSDAIGATMVATPAIPNVNTPEDLRALG